MELLKFINKNKDWLEKLSKKPYCISTSKSDKYLLLKYDQIDSDFKEAITKECRGIILRQKDLVPVCVPFYKFFNYGESQASIIDWNTARVEEKLDGSLIKMWFDEFWHVSTNGSIDAFITRLAFSESISFGDLFTEAIAPIVGDIENWEQTLNKNYTYMFELCHPLNKIVIHYSEPIVYHIGTRDNTTFKELNTDIGVPKPKEYKFNSIEDVIDMAENLPYSEEGYVVVDKHCNRVKIKSPSYVAVHHLKNNGVITYKRIIELVLKNEQEEFTTYFPEFKQYIKKATTTYNNFVRALTLEFNEIKSISFTSRKAYAEIANKSVCPSFMYKALDNGWDAHQIIPFLTQMRRKNLVELLKLKDEVVAKPTNTQD